MINKNKTSIYLGILSYLCVMYIFASFIIIGLALGYALIYELDFMQILNTLIVLDFTELTPEILKASAVIQGYGNLIAYLLVTVLVVIFLRKYLVSDFNKVKENPKKFLSYSFVAGILFILISLVIDIIVSRFVSSSQNQATIEMIFANGGALPMVISVVLLAPVVEELIFRKAIFELLENSGKRVAYAASILLFTLPHMLSTQSSILTWFIQCIPYAACGFMLCYI